MTLAFSVYGVAQPKGSMRAFQPRGFDRPIVTDGNRNVKDWQRLVAAAASAALDRLSDADRQMVADGVRCEIWYYLPRPKALTVPKYRDATILHTKRPDLDKLTRGIFDALTSVVWADDAQVVELLTTKRYAATGAPARVDIRISPLPAPRALLPLLERDDPRDHSRRWYQERLSVSGLEDE